MTNPEDLNNEIVQRLRELSGLTPRLGNSTTVAGTPVAESEIFSEDLGPDREHKLNDIYQAAEVDVQKAGNAIKRYAQYYSHCESYMNDDEKTHWGYAIRALIDQLEDVLNDVQKLG